MYRARLQKNYETITLHVVHNKHAAIDTNMARFVCHRQAGESLRLLFQNANSRPNISITVAKFHSKPSHIPDDLKKTNTSCAILSFFAPNLISSTTRIPSTYLFNKTVLSVFYISLISFNASLLSFNSLFYLFSQTTPFLYISTFSVIPSFCPYPFTSRSSPPPN